MDVYLLDDLFRRIDLVDRYESFIWTERYAEAGDFEPVVISDRSNREKLEVGVRLAILRSHRVMTIETVEKGVNENGIATLRVVGRSLEAELENRVAAPELIGTEAQPRWDITGRPDSVVRVIFDRTCEDSTITYKDNYPYQTLGQLYPLETIPLPVTTASFSLEIDNAYNTIKKICDIYDLGFRWYRGPDDSKLYFDCHTGNDRTTNQTTYPPVVFSPNMDNLTDTNELMSIAEWKNVAYVFAPGGARSVYADGVDTETIGFERRILLVRADDITIPAGPEWEAAVIQRGKEELAKHRIVRAFDGEVPRNGEYRYMVDYYLGDIVELRDDEGLSSRMRVTEQIFISDKEGIREYPTLTMDMLVEPGTWFSWNPTQTWSQVTQTWAEA